MDWQEIVYIVITILALVFGGKFWLKWKHMTDVFKELGEAFTKTSKALEDKKLTKDEMRQLLNEWMDVANVIMVLLNRKINGR